MDLRARDWDIEPAINREHFECAGPKAFAAIAMAIWIGADRAEPGVPLHNSRYDFNDDILGLGAAYWVSLAELILTEPSS